jgi:hypothetical protein
MLIGEHGGVPMMSFSEAIFLGAPIGNNLCPDKFLASGVHSPMLFIAYIQRDLVEDSDGDFPANGNAVNILVPFLAQLFRLVI